jgi:hypothetical protein
MVYNYKIGYYSHEESYYVELFHENKFMDNEITEMVADATISVIKKMKGREEGVHGFEDIMNDGLIQFLIEKYDFKRLTYENIWTVFGWASIFDKTDWKGDRDERLNKLTDALIRAGYTEKDDDYLRQNRIIEKFGSLKGKLNEETLFTSSINEMENNELYKEIIAMGEEILPYLLIDLRRNDFSIWHFLALRTITGISPVKEENKGYVEKMKEDWLEWFRRNE